jgi:hypothetical protein
LSDGRTGLCCQELVHRHGGKWGNGER